MMSPSSWPCELAIINIRRLGLEPFQGLLNVDTGVVELSLTMTQSLNTLPAMRITESAVDRVKQALEKNGYVSRSGLGIAKTFVDRADVLRRKYQWFAEILATYGIHPEDNPSLLLDNVPVTFDLLANYPAELVIGVEIYRHNLPIEFSTQRPGAPALDPSGHGQRDIMRPTVIIWTFIP